MRAVSLMAVAVVALASCGASGGGGGGGGGTTPSAASSLIPSSPTTTPTTGSSGGTTAPATVNNLSFAGMLNNVRAQNGAGNVTHDSRLTAAAQGHADDMLAHNYLSHTGRNGSTPGDRMTAAGYRWRTYGENIAQGQRSETEVLDAWTNSPGHHANNVNPNFEDFGLAKAGSGGQTRWVLLLGAE